MNLTEIARQLKIPTKELKEQLPVLGFDIGMKAIKVPDDMAQHIIERWHEEKKRASIAAKYQKNEETDIEIEGNKGDPRVLKIPQSIAVRNLADIFHLSPPAMIAELMKHGIMASLSEKVDFDIATIVAEGLGYTSELVTEQDRDSQRQEEIQAKMKEIKRVDKETSSERPPVVVIMGHVDHGKTKLLDAIRESKVVESEAGGITQHIGAYQVENKDKLITFIDTPGHEAFSAMRSRGANVADIAVLVVAADSGVQPQTIESIKMIQDAGLSMLVAINKIDKPEADIDRVKKELSEVNVIPEDWGGQTICVPISAKEKIHLDDLLDMIVLVAEMNQDQIRARRDIPAVGTIIESHLDKGTGPVATVLIHQGTLKQGDQVRVGTVLGKVRTMVDYTNNKVKSAGPSTPVRIIGLSDVPQVGEILEAGVDLRMLKRQNGSRKRIQTSSLAESSEESKGKVKKLNVIIKADVAGSLEALQGALKKYKSKGVVVNIVYHGLGNITEVDVVRAESTKAKILGFNVTATPQAWEVAKEKEIDLKVFKVIYKLIEQVEADLSTLLDPEVVRITKGTGKVLQLFRGHKDNMIVGVRLSDGEIKNTCKIVVERNGQIVGEGSVKELRSGPEKVSIIMSGHEFGLLYGGSVDLLPGDKLEFFEEQEKKRTLSFFS